MSKKILKIVNKSPNPNPAYAKKGDSGFDLRAWINEGGVSSITLKPFERKLIHTGIYTQLPEGTEIQVRTRSGCALKQGLIVANTPGTVDQFYTGEICIIAINLSNEDIIINNGDRIAQAVLMPVYNEQLVTLDYVESIEDNTERGSTGFGSSGIK